MEEPIMWDQVHALMEELRDMASGLLASENSAQSLSPTALVLTALRRQKPGGWEVPFDEVEVTWPNRRYFFGAMYRAMWQALVDHAKARGAAKRVAVQTVQVEQIHLENAARTVDEHPEQIEPLKDALERLRTRHPEWAELIEHRFFSGLTVQEAARVMGIGERTARRWWDQARLLLHDEVLRVLSAEDGGMESTHEVAN